MSTMELMQGMVKLVQGTVKLTRGTVSWCEARW